MVRPSVATVVRRVIVFAAIAFWLGGFTFYSSVVVHVGATVLRSHLRQGLITQQVTHWLNFSGALALAILLYDVAVTWRTLGPLTRKTLAGAWVVMAASQIALFWLHPHMDRLIDLAQKQVVDEPRFDTLHTAYVSIATIQWGAGVVYCVCLIAMGAFGPVHAPEQTVG